MLMTIYKTQGGAYTIRKITHQGKSHLIVPVVMMKEGVHNGSHGPLFHSAEELGKFPDSWNGIPVSILHPSKDGKNVSANSPDIIDSTVVGRVYNSFMEGGKLRGEVWLDEERLPQVSPQAFSYINQGFPLEVSLGVFTDDEMVEGNWNGEAYSGIAHNHRPDHLALLPGGTGACSWADGCGIRTNSVTPEIAGKLKEMNIAGYSLQTFAPGYEVIIEQLRRYVYSKETNIESYYLEEVFPTFFIFKVRGGMNSGLFQQGYYFDTNNTVVVTEEIFPVVKQVTYTRLSDGLKLNYDFTQARDSSGRWTISGFFPGKSGGGMMFPSKTAIPGYTEVKLTSTNRKSVISGLSPGDVVGPNGNYVLLESKGNSWLCVSKDVYNAAGKDIMAILENEEIEKKNLVTSNLSGSVYKPDQSHYQERNKAMSNDAKKPCCPEKVELLIQNDASKFVEADREWLLLQTAETMEKLQPVIVEKVKEVEVNSGTPENITKEQAVQVLSEQLSDPKKFMTLLPAEVRAQLEHGMKLYTDHRAELITKITDNGEVWTKEELGLMKTDFLEKIVKTVKPVVNYAGQGSGFQANAEDEEVLMPAGFAQK